MSSKVMHTKQASCWESQYIQKSESSELGPWVPGVHQPRGGERARANAMTGLLKNSVPPHAPHHDFNTDGVVLTPM
jgi:hypothetical protein